MSFGQLQAKKEIERLNFVGKDTIQFNVLNEPGEKYLRINLSIKIGPIEFKEGGLNLKEREDFLLLIPKDFPYEIPILKVDHNRFAGFPHVIWSHILCLYQSELEWNPSDGLYGFFDRLRLWLHHAAINDMDPIEGPLEPPHHIVDTSHLPFVIRVNSPTEVGKNWFGLAEIRKFENRNELVGWNDLTGDWPAEPIIPALSIFLPEPLPMEFPENGKEFFNELSKQNIDRQRVLRDLRIAAMLTPEGEPAYLVLGIPMRRSPEGNVKHHIAVWTFDAEQVNNLKIAAPRENDKEEILKIKTEINDLVYSIFELSRIKWCKVMEDRSEILIRRDFRSPLKILERKNILILGCGALGSWIAEIMVRADVNRIDLVDKSLVKPGLLVRQNYQLDDIGAYKVNALKKRLLQISSKLTINSYSKEAFLFITENIKNLKKYDLIIDCTASSIFQMKVERDWSNFKDYIPPIVSLVIDANARNCIVVAVEPNSSGGIWNSFIQLKYQICISNQHKDLISSFYTNRVFNELFQPEPGCSDPTFSGSSSDILNLTSTSVNLICSQLNKSNYSFSYAFSINGNVEYLPFYENIKFFEMKEISINQFRVRIATKIITGIKSWVRKNNRTRSSTHETGGLIWGLWDEALKIIWLFDISGPPVDSVHDPAHFICGIEGTAEEHKKRMEISHGITGFIGFWHTHPFMPSKQSIEDQNSMINLIATIGENRKKAIMLILGRKSSHTTAGLYIYESTSLQTREEEIKVHFAQFPMETNIL